MASYTQLYLHCVWATWDRLPLITPRAEPRIYGVIDAKCRELGCIPIAIGDVDDHVHLLVQYTATITIARLIGEVKGASSHVMTHEVAPGDFFKWQGHYGVFTISRRSVPDVKRYVLHQKQYHADEQLIHALELTESDDA
jgi:putative transposase